MFFIFLCVLILVDVMKLNVNEINSLVLAYLGDAVFELEIRSYLLSKKINNVNVMQKNAVNYVSATAQKEILKQLMEKNILTSDEKALVKRARNYKPHSKPKNTDIVTYKKATALEALFGMLYLKNDKKRIEEIMKQILG